ncbi:MAG: putative toxin-antitoxin system toxin component, PIN family [Deltaproteobacteria bacterium]|jgi:putative PIN family toxin of toxin-antitoxin system|nr:putative toxin-antitoxin system toxin component, PIN family [Deltaproteobacteria bacterium]
MKVMADTNVIISTLLFPSSLPAKVLLHIASNHDLVLCDHIVTEIRDVVSRKRPDLSGDCDVLLAQLSYELVIAPEKPDKLIHDPKDQPILQAAIMAGVDVIVSGDKHFLKLNLERPRTMSPAEFWQLEQ